MEIPKLTPKRITVLFFFTFLSKCLLNFYLIRLTMCQNPDAVFSNFSLVSNDDGSYLGAMENWLQHGSYYWWNGEEKIYASRVPHYGIIYLAFRILMNPAHAADCLVLFQIAIEALSIIALSSLVHRLTGDKKAFLITFLLLFLSTHISHFNSYLMPEGLAINFLSLFLFFFLKKPRSNTDLFVSGIFLALACCMRPFIPYLYLPIILVIYIESKQDLKKTIIQAVSVGIGFILLTTPWIIRNAFIYKRLIPLQVNAYAGERRTPAKWAMYDFLGAWGGSITYWDHRSALSYFMPDHNRFKKTSTFSFPSYVFTKKYSLKDMEPLRRQFVEAEETQSKEKIELVAKKLNEYAESFKQEKPFHYYFIAPLVRTKIMIFHSGSYYLPIAKNFKCYHPYQFGIKVFQSLLYYFVLIFGSIGLVYMLTLHIRHLILLSIPLGVIVIVTVFTKNPEFRYFHIAYPTLALTASVFLARFHRRVSE